MAYDDSGELPIASDPSEENTYDLGGYSFELEVQSVHEPGEPDAVSVFAICRSPDGTRETKAMDFPPGTTVTGWYVEANETEASVYANISGGKEPTPIPGPIPHAESFTTENRPDYPLYDSAAAVWSGARFVAGPRSGSNWYFVEASDKPGTANWQKTKTTGSGTSTLNRTYIYNGKTVYYNIENAAWSSSITCPVIPSISNAGAIAWMIVYGDTEVKDGERLIGRFAIDLREADGGPDGDWDEPGDDGDPSYTLYVSVTGASAGTHTGGVPSTPSDAEVYGCGGTGGNGGGGGAGASTVIIYDFATSKAGSVEQEANSRGPGAGGPGGRGGKGADGCILVFY